MRPNSGRVEPGKEVEVSGMEIPTRPDHPASPNTDCTDCCAPVILQAMKQEPPPDTKCRDKFLVQAVPITSDKEFANLASIVSQAENLVLEKIAFVA